MSRRLTTEGRPTKHEHDDEAWIYLWSTYTQWFKQDMREERGGWNCITARLSDDQAAPTGTSVGSNPDKGRGDSRESVEKGFSFIDHCSVQSTPRGYGRVVVEFGR